MPSYPIYNSTDELKNDLLNVQSELKEIQAGFHPRAFNYLNYLLRNPTLVRQFILKMEEIKQKDRKTFVHPQLLYRSFYSDRFVNNAFIERDKEAIQKLTDLMQEKYAEQVLLDILQDNELIIPDRKPQLKDYPSSNHYASVPPKNVLHENNVEFYGLSNYRPPADPDNSFGLSANPSVTNYQ